MSRLNCSRTGPHLSSGRLRWTVVKAGCIFYYKTPQSLRAQGLFSLEGYKSVYGRGALIADWLAGLRFKKEASSENGCSPSSLVVVVAASGTFQQKIWMACNTGSKKFDRKSTKSLPTHPSRMSHMFVAPSRCCVRAYDDDSVSEDDSEEVQTTLPLASHPFIDL